MLIFNGAANWASAMKLLGSLLLMALLCGCVLSNPRPLTFEEQEAYMAKQQCAQEATQLNPDWPGSANPSWNSYFIMCMNSLGIPDSAISSLWFE